MDDQPVQIPFGNVGQALDTARSKGVAFRDTLLTLNIIQRTETIRIYRVDRRQRKLYGMLYRSRLTGYL